MMTDKEFSERIEATTETLYRMSYSQLPQKCDRDDTIQETILKAWSKRASLKDERLLQTWLVRILLNECHNIQRKRKRETLCDKMPERAAPPNSDAELHDALFRIGDELRLPIVLHYMEGFSVAEIAGILRLPQSTVKWRMSKARKELAAVLGDETTTKKEVHKPCLKQDI
jgi:RNA polymerase sigma-70 factor (ECF subfamily)